MVYGISGHHALAIWRGWGWSAPRCGEVAVRGPARHAAIQSGERGHRPRGLDRVTAIRAVAGLPGAALLPLVVPGFQRQFAIALAGGNPPDRPRTPRELVGGSEDDRSGFEGMPGGMRPAAGAASHLRRLQRWLYAKGWGETPEETVARGVAEIERITDWKPTGNILADHVRGLTNERRP